MHKEMGAKVPTCEECGKVELTEEEENIWLTLFSHTGIIIQTDGFGWSLKLDGIQYLAGRLGIDDPLVLVRIAQALAYNMTYTEPKPEEDKPNG